MLCGEADVDVDHVESIEGPEAPCVLPDEVKPLDVGIETNARNVGSKLGEDVAGQVVGHEGADLVRPGRGGTTRHR